MAHYYQAFDAEATRPSLAALYQPQSMLSFEGSQLMVRLFHACYSQLHCVRSRVGRVAGVGVAVCGAKHKTLPLSWEAPCSSR